MTATTALLQLVDLTDALALQVAVGR